MSIHSIGALDGHLNELYWNSERTIEEIARQLGVGRNTLYRAIRPLPAGYRCGRCGTDLTYPSRRARGAGTATCSRCGREVAIAHAHAAVLTADRPGGANVDRSSGWTSRERAFNFQDRAALIGGATALGIVLGAAATRVVRA